MKLRTTLLSAGAGAAVLAGVLSTAGPAFAKSDTSLTGPHSARVGHAFHLQVSVGDDAGAQQAWARLQILGPHGKYSWYGKSQRLHIDRSDPYQENGTFTITPRTHGTEVFRAIITGYATTSTVTVQVR